MIDTLLQSFLAYVTFVRPVIYGAQLCKAANPDPRQVTNTTLALVFSWLWELTDMVFLSSFIAARTVYTAARIVLCLYLSHPTFLGALRVYEKMFAPLVDAYGPAVDAMFMQHMDTIAQSGIVHYSTKVGLSLFRATVDVVDIAKRLMESTAETEVPAAELPRRLSVGHNEPVHGSNNDDESDKRREDQYVTASVVAKVRRTASERGYPSPSSSNVSPPPPEALPQQPAYARTNRAVEAQPARHPPLPPPSPPPPQQQQRLQNPFEPSDEEDYFEESLSEPLTSPPAAAHRRAYDTARQADSYYHGSDYGYH